MTDRKTCLNCKKQFIANPTKKFCNMECYLEHTNTKEWRSQISQKVKLAALFGKRKKRCIECKKMFTSNSSSHTLCSTYCKKERVKKRNRAQVRDRDCKSCGKLYKPTRVFRKACSQKCRKNLFLNSMSVYWDRSKKAKH